VWLHACLLRIIPSATGIIPESRANPRGRPDTDYRLYENCWQNVGARSKEVEALNILYLFFPFYIILQNPLSTKCDSIFANSVTIGASDDVRHDFHD